MLGQSALRPLPGIVAGFCVFLAVCHVEICGSNTNPYVSSLASRREKCSFAPSPCGPRALHVLRGGSSSGGEDSDQDGSDEKLTKQERRRLLRERKRLAADAKYGQRLRARAEEQLKQENEDIATRDIHCIQTSRDHTSNIAERGKLESVEEMWMRELDIASKTGAVPPTFDEVAKRREDMKRQLFKFHVSNSDESFQESKDGEGEGKEEGEEEEGIGAGWSKMNVIKGDTRSPMNFLSSSSEEDSEFHRKVEHTRA
eukprot:754944-Hanusia_phi.AAC.2